MFTFPPLSDLFSVSLADGWALKMYGLLTHLLCVLCHVTSTQQILVFQKSLRNGEVAFYTQR